MSITHTSSIMRKASALSPTNLGPRNVASTTAPVTVLTSIVCPALTPTGTVLNPSRLTIPGHSRESSSPGWIPSLPPAFQDLSRKTVRPPFLIEVETLMPSVQSNPQISGPCPTTVSRDISANASKKRSMGVAPRKIALRSCGTSTATLVLPPTAYPTRSYHESLSEQQIRMQKIRNMGELLLSLPAKRNLSAPELLRRCSQRNTTRTLYWPFTACFGANGGLPGFSV